MRFTLFPDRRALTKTEHEMTWPAFCDGIANARAYANKDSCPLISLAVYGEERSPNNSLRHAANLIAISGLAGEHDSGTVSIEEAADRVRLAGFKAVIHTTASHKESAPRWRILVPLARERPLPDLEVLMDGLNGALNGALTGESWTPSQCFHIGRVIEVPYRCIDVA